MIVSADPHGGMSTHDFPLPESAHTMRAAEFRAVLAELLSLAVADPDKTLVLLGDVFNSRRPPAWAYAAFAEFLCDCELEGVTVIAFRGNHDAAGIGQAEPAHAFVGYARFDYIDRPRVVGVGDTGLLMIPWFSRMGTAQMHPDATVSEQHDLMRQHLALMVSDLIGRAEAAQYKRLVPCLHASIGGVTFASETQPVLGTTSEFMASYKVFDVKGIAAVFSGHVHRPQEFGAGVRVYYPGAPVHTDFGDPLPRRCISYVNGVVEWVNLTAATPLLTFPLVVDADGTIDVEIVPSCKVERAVVRMKGELHHTAENVARVLVLQQSLMARALRTEKPAITWQKGAVAGGGSSINVRTDPTTALEVYLSQADDTVRERVRSVMQMHAHLLEEVR
jgi:DNA repair exonuclease SbcCD nuclease subunit